MAHDLSLLDWMLETDPALRWQVERDLLGEPESVWRATRARIGTEGLGARMLAHQDPDGQWAGGAFFPQDFEAEEYLLERRLLYRLSTGEPVADWATHFAYPFRHFYSALNALDYFRTVGLQEGRAPDPRLREAIEVVRAARRPDGSLLQERRHPGRVWFEVDVPVGQASPWLTLIATRALDWWDQA